MTLNLFRLTLTALLSLASTQAFASGSFSCATSAQDKNFKFAFSATTAHGFGDALTGFSSVEINASKYVTLNILAGAAGFPATKSKLSKMAQIFTTKRIPFGVEDVVQYSYDSNIFSSSAANPDQDELKIKFYKDSPAVPKSKTQGAVAVGFNGNLTLRIQSRFDARTNKTVSKYRVTLEQGLQDPIDINGSITCTSIVLD